MKAVRVIAAVSLLVAGTGAFADALSDIKRTGVIRAGYAEASVPFSFATKEGVPQGYSIELCKRAIAGIAKAAGVASPKTEWVVLTPATRVDAVASGKVHLECSTTSATLGRREKVDFSIPIYLDAASIMSRRSSAPKGQLSDLQGKKIAVARGTTTLTAVERGLARRFVKAQIVPVATVADGFDMLKAGKVDALASDRTHLVGSFIGAGGAEGLMVFPEALSYEPYAIMLPRGDAALRLAVDRSLAEVFRGGDIEQIYKDWLAPLGDPSPALIALYLMNALPE
jgi:glutamate/aspartate transport system substrate-binding protein